MSNFGRHLLEVDILACPFSSLLQINLEGIFPLLLLHSSLLVLEHHCVPGVYIKSLIRELPFCFLLICLFISIQNLIFFILVLIEI